MGKFDDLTEQQRIFLTNTSQWAEGQEDPVFIWSGTDQLREANYDRDESYGETYEGVPKDRAFYYQMEAMEYVTLVPIGNEQQNLQIRLTALCSKYDAYKKKGKERRVLDDLYYDFSQGEKPLAKLAWMALGAVIARILFC